ncbi:putative pol Retrovirus-related Pol polyprotein from transposon-like 24 [Homarus americanus]|uniref:Putative pol Retrovirus-related Pol polyprotein from transposon-like 24 n=1 Tax=Homarus americanus TaxID=6706 RepID=A0A8J5JRQ9_HOMAM|nr:putative pol Retrovirus-related Pol polyprotein from transposon-like 24 [Homarus americanus]
MCNRWNDAFREVQVEVGEKLKQHKQKVSGNITEVCGELQKVSSRMEALENCLTAGYQPRSSDLCNCDGVLETSFVHALSRMNSVEKSGKYDDRVEIGSVELNYRAHVLRPRATSSEVVNYPREPVKKKPQEFDGKVSREAYQAQFELFAEQNGWDDKQCTVQLATNLKGAAMEVFSQLTGAERSSYMSLVKIGHKEEDCYKWKREREKDNAEKNMEKKMYWTCGEDGHFKTSCPQNSKRGKAEQPTKTGKNRDGWCSGVHGALHTLLGVVKPDFQQCCQGEGLSTKCSRTTMKDDPAVAGKGLQTLQLEDHDLRPVVELMSQSSVRPAWEMISGASPTTKNHGAQWDAFRHQWATTNGLNTYWQTVQLQVRGALEFLGEVMKRNHDVKASQICYKDGDKVWLYNPLRKKGQTPKLQSPWGGPYTVVERPLDVAYRSGGRGKAQPKYTWEDSEDQSHKTDEDQTGDPGRTQGSTDPENPTMYQEKEHRSLLEELDVTGEGDHSEYVAEVAAPRDDFDDIPVRRRQH